MYLEQRVNELEKEVSELRIGSAILLGALMGLHKRDDIVLC